jgi:protein O-GlcNAc transferase
MKRKVGPYFSLGASTRQWHASAVRKLPRLDGKAFERALTAYRARSFTVAGTLLARIVSEDPRHAGAHYVLGLLALERDHLTEAQARFSAACELEPQNPGFLSNRAETLRCLGRLDEAIEGFELSLAFDEQLVESWFNLGLAHAARGSSLPARHAFARAAALRPGDRKLEQRLARAHQELGELDAASELLQSRLARDPDDARSHAQLGVVQFHLGRHTEALASLRRSLALEPAPETHSALLFQLMFASGVGALDLREEARAFGKRYAPPELALPEATRNRVLDPERRLKVGYVSAAFREHVTANVVLPLLRHHDRERFEIFCYASQASSDATTNTFRGVAEHFVDVVGLDDDQAAAQIARDEIDILVDLTMHMAGNRLQVFARKPAPLQLTWFAYPGTTGLDSIDYRISDVFLDPPNVGDELYVERTLRLPDSFWCWEPLLDELDSGPPPSLARGHVTFGCLNNFCKVTDETLELWCQVLRALPDARLLLLAPVGSARERVRERLSRLGVSGDRVRFVAHQARRPYFELYREIDVCLDTLPYGGHTTSLDAFWMGVPVVTLVGDRLVGRAGLCQAHHLGLPELVATTSAELVERSVALARNFAKLSELRQTLRARLSASPLMNGPRFATQFEALYRTIWRSWCVERSAT